MFADNYLQLRTELETALAGLLKLSSDMRRDPATLDILHGLLTDIREPLLFVVVGEVKAGKSSLLNALFGHEFARVDVRPATDRVYIFRYGAEEKSVEVSPQLTERYLPISFLQNFNVVDTPGTNTMVAEHQTITESFIPRADLVLFVFSVVNPWSQSAWDLLNFVQKKWLKNTVFVLQQADLREPAEIEVIHQHLQDTAMQKLAFAPPIFPVSARKALLARTTGLDKERLWQESNFGPLEEQIDRMVTESGAGVLKLQSTAKTAGVILGDVAEEIRGCFDTILRDEKQLSRMGEFLQARKDQTLRQVAGFLRGVEQACRESAQAGNAHARNKALFLANMATRLEPGAMAAGIPNGSGSKTAPDRPAPGGECGSVAGNRSARALAPIARHASRRNSIPAAKTASARRCPISRASAAISCNRFSSRWSSASRAREWRSNWPGCFGKQPPGFACLPGWPRPAESLPSLWP